MNIDFISLKYSNEKYLKHSWSDKICEIIGKRFQSLLHRYHIGLENSMKFCIQSH